MRKRGEILTFCFVGEINAKALLKVSVSTKNESHSRPHANANTHAMKKKHAIGPKMSDMMRYRELS